MLEYILKAGSDLHLGSNPLATKDRPGLLMGDFLLNHEARSKHRLACIGSERLWFKAKSLILVSGHATQTKGPVV